MTETHVESPDFAVCASVCPHHFGFLSQRAKGSAIPDECLTCEKVIDCILLKPEDTAAEPETKPELSAVERTKDSAKESGEEHKGGRSEEGGVKHNEADESNERTSNNDFHVESPGMLYARWSGTVLIRKETLDGWGDVREVDIETERGKIMTCKVYAVEDLEKGVIHVPDKMQLKLGVKKGSIVKVKPAVNP
jgi:hypothetical protein